jgi:hypothetical protein
MLSSLFAHLTLSRDTRYFERVLSNDLAELPIHAVSPYDKARLSWSVQRYSIDAPVAKVFAAYLLSPPSEAWPRDRFAFRFAVRANGVRIAPGDAWPGLEVGMKIFGDLLVDPPRGRLRIMVPVVVTRVAPPNIVRYEYLENAVTMGHNEILFTEEPDCPRTRVCHTSEYRGTSPFARLLMPVMQRRLHVGFVDAMHGGMKRRLEGAIGAR